MATLSSTVYTNCVLMMVTKVDLGDEFSSIELSTDINSILNGLVRRRQHEISIVVRAFPLCSIRWIEKTTHSSS